MARINTRKTLFHVVLLGAACTLLCACFKPQNDLLLDQDPVQHHRARFYCEHGSVKAEAPCCPRYRTKDGRFAPHANLGCITAQNRVLMVADHNDMLPHERPPMWFYAKPLGDAVRHTMQGEKQTLNTDRVTNTNLVSSTGLIGSLR